MSHYHRNSHGELARSEAKPMFVSRLAFFALVVITTAAVLPGVGRADVGMDREVQMTNDEYEKLDTFEAHVLQKADKVFAKEDYKRAAAEYDSFILEFPRSRAIPYALMRKGRSLHHEGKRFEAVREYTQVLDYFPNSIRYAAAALTYTGWAHWENHDNEKALTAWAKVAADKDYAKQPIAAGGLLKLAHHHRDERRYDKAVDYYERIAVNFRKSAHHVARQAIRQVAYQYVRRDPNEPALRAFYKKAGTTDHRPRSVDESVEELLNDRGYWNDVRGFIHHWGRFNKDQVAQRNRFYRYWAEQMDGRFAGWDDYQIDLANYKLKYENDRGKWMQRIDEQFNRGYETGDVDRVIRWMKIYRGFDSKWKQYYNKLTLSELDNNQLERLMHVLFKDIHHDRMAENVFGHINWDKMSDKDLDGLRRLLWHESEKLYMLTCQHYTSSDRGKYLMLEYHHARRDPRREDAARHIEKGVELANQLQTSEAFASGAIWMKAELLHAGRRWKEAIAAYRTSDRAPANLKGIVECWLGLGEQEKAIATLREIENFFKKQSAWAAYRIAQIYNAMGKRDKYIAELRGIMKKYAGSPQSSDAHRHLERMGIKIGGYVESDDE